MDFLTALEVLAPPPAGVEPLGDEAWAQFEAENGFRPPADYRALIDRYGVGGFGPNQSPGPWLNVLHPVRPGTTFVEHSAWLRSVNIGFQRQFPDLEPDWPMWPAAGGFLQWAESLDGDQLGWLTADEPDQWGTAIYGRQMDHYRFEFGCVEFLYRCFTGSLGVDDLENLASDEPRFFPSPPPSPEPVRRPTVQVTIRFAGVGAGGDGMPEAGHSGAITIVDQWVADLPAQAITLRSYGRSSMDEPLHWEISIELPKEREDVAKELVVSLSADLGTPVRECRNIEYDLVWDDVVRRTT